MSRSHDTLTHTLRMFKTSLRTGATPVVPMRAAESGKCQTSNMRRHRNRVMRGDKSAIMGCRTDGIESLLIVISVERRLHNISQQN